MQAPQAPDPGQTAQAQYQANVAAAQQQQQLSAVDQVTPYGTLTYSQLPWDPQRMRATTALTPAMQKLVNTNIASAQGSANIANQLQGNVASTASRPLDLSWGATEQQLNDLNRHTLDPLWARNQQTLEQQLYDRGVRPGTEAYDNAMRDFNTQKSDAYNAAFQQNHQLAVQDILNQYNNPINAAAAWRSGGQIQQPGIVPINTPQAQAIQPAPYADLTSQNYKNAVAQYDQTLGGLFGLAGNVAGIVPKLLP